MGNEEKARVKEQDADLIVADIVTKDNSSVLQRFVVNRHTGFSGQIRSEPCGVTDLITV